MNQKQYIGIKIRQYRQDKLGASIKDLGEMLHPKRSASAVQSWETGRTEPDADTLIELCVLFGVDIKDFYLSQTDACSRTESAKVGGHELSNVSLEEWSLLDAYRSLDSQHRKFVNEVVGLLASKPNEQSC